MSTKATLNLEGFDEYLEELVQAAEDIDAVVDECLVAGAEVLVSGMQRRAPFAMLRSAVSKTQVYQDGNKHYLYIGILRTTDAETARVGNVWEFGGRDRPSSKHPKRKPRPGIVSHPFIRPTLKRDAKTARAAMEGIFKDWLEK